ncbi:zinc ribbon domain-containing protein [Halopelagius longus]|uniref:Zinc ribbon domain-containing protein n=1 Tax=Halopelagius longus TaxID=1236180 RepID=A0A1H1D668_9EURY|nr:zinc ribbon domain-containing protein [Halopelagius longus]RDI71187.1 zinc ribbon domain-containing protein [Halopelagius longus]SDQ71934.1 hypothetical protein SAMN05216278_2248 [Halopelagius longus]
MADTRRRAMVAALVGVLGASVGIAGAGHVYLRRWRRALAWFTFVVAVGVALVFAFADPTTVSVSDPSALPTEVTGPVFALLFLSTVDAYYVAARGHRGESGPRCPNCGGELDAQMTFCPWCATELKGRPDGVENVDVEERGDEVK